MGRAKQDLGLPPQALPPGQSALLRASQEPGKNQDSPHDSAKEAMSRNEAMTAQNSVGPRKPAVDQHETSTPGRQHRLPRRAKTLIDYTSLNSGKPSRRAQSVPKQANTDEQPRQDLGATEEQITELRRCLAETPRSELRRPAGQKHGDDHGRECHANAA